MIRVSELERYVHLYETDNYRRKNRLLGTLGRDLKFCVTSNSLDKVLKKNKNPPEIRQVKEYTTILRDRVVDIVDCGHQREWHFESEERLP